MISKKNKMKRWKNVKWNSAGEEIDRQRVYVVSRLKKVLSRHAEELISLFLKKSLDRCYNLKIML